MPFIVETVLVEDDVQELLRSGVFKSVDNNNLLLNIVVGLLPSCSSAR